MGAGDSPELKGLEGSGGDIWAPAASWAGFRAGAAAQPTRGTSKKVRSYEEMGPVEICSDLPSSVLTPYLTLLLIPSRSRQKNHPATQLQYADTPVS